MRKNKETTKSGVPGTAAEPNISILERKERVCTNVLMKELESECGLKLRQSALERIAAEEAAMVRLRHYQTFYFLYKASSECTE